MGGVRMLMVEADNPGELEEALGIALGITRWDGHSLASYLRKTPKPSRIVILAIASLIDGSRPDGMHLKLRGQGSGMTIKEGANAYNQVLEIGEFFREREAVGETWEEVVFDASEQFGISEATVSRRLALFKILQADPTITD